ncbi:cell division protein SepF [Ornithinibacillus salinisoli]|uniref:Cell division protein SepF n=1 Tax=Ornithinibacillus salinisoli TaxID=1848459 RepID=A0ABW4W067_9BACI
MSIKNKIKNFFTMDEEYEYVEESMEQPDFPATTARDNVVNLKRIEKMNSKVVLCEPRTYNEVQEIADNIINRRAVVINLQRTDLQQAKQIVDFLSGTVYALNGKMQKLGSQTFLCVPDNVDVSGSISESFAEVEEFNKGW